MRPLMKCGQKYETLMPCLIWHPAFTDSHIENDETGDKERLLAIGDGVFQGGFDALKTAFAT